MIARVIRLLIVLFLASVVQQACAQNALGTWRTLLNYSRAIDVDRLNDRVFVATENGLFIYDLNDHSLETLNRVNGLSDVGITLIKAIPEKNILMVGYENGNIDLIRDRQVTNVPDIRNSVVQGNKTIRHATIGQEFVYLSTGLGVLAFDVERREVRNTYQIVPEENISVNHTTLLDNVLYAATDQGLFAGDLSTDLTIFNNWEIDLGIPVPFGNVGHCESAGPNLFISQNNATPPGLYRRVAPATWELAVETNDIRYMGATGSTLVLNTSSSAAILVNDGMDFLLNLFNYGSVTARPARAIVDQDGILRIADLRSGLVNRTPSGDIDLIAPDGPGTNRAFSLTLTGDELWVASGTLGRPGVWANAFDLNGFYGLREGRWTNYMPDNLPILSEEVMWDVASVYRFPGDEEHVLVGSWFSGAIEVINGEVVNHFTTDNTTLLPWPEYNRPDNKDWLGVTAFREDDDGNVWMINVRSEEPLAVYRTDGTWENFGIENLVSRTTPGFDMIINRQGHHWMLFNRSGVVVFDENRGDPAGPKVHRFSASDGSGGLPSNDVNTIVEDLDGAIWVGTSDGIGVFFSPFDVFSGQPSDARPIIVEQGGIFQPLFENQSISKLAVDGANRKWVGTFGSGLFLMSADGTDQIHHFTTANSPLLSNTINDIAINPRTGEVYIATENGLMSYSSDATQGQFANNCTSVFPNPVRETYSGPISITGLVRDSQVRITDVRGNLIYQTVSNGGTAVWDGTNLNRQRVATGVYFALSSDPEGNSTCVSKILVIK